MLSNFSRPRAFLRPRETSRNTLSVAEQKIKFPEMCEFVERELSPSLRFDDDNHCRLIIVNAPVKSGKRCIVEYIASLDKIPGSNDSTCVNIFISAFHRVADKSQRDELSRYGLIVHSINNEKNANKAVNEITTYIASGKNIKVHLDEADYGTGCSQKMAIVWEFIKGLLQVKTILYSATIEEAVYADRDLMEGVTRNIVDSFQTDNIKYVKYTPPSTFCGPEKFLEEGLVDNAIPFFNLNQTHNTIELSEQAKSIMLQLRDEMEDGSNSNILIVRLSYALDIFGNNTTRKDKKAIRVFLSHIDLFHELEGCIIIVDKTSSEDFICHSENVIFEQVQWSSSIYWRQKTQTVPIIVIMDQTSSRSTEWACHDRVFAVHNFSRSIFYNNSSQQDERTNHYITKYEGGFQRIQIYAHKRTFEYSAGLITVGSYLQGEFKMKAIRDTNQFCIINNDSYLVVQGACNGNSDIRRGRICEGYSHCTCGRGLEKSSAEQIMLELGSHCVPKLSPRITSDVKDKPDVRKIFVPCQSDDEYNEMIADPESSINRFLKERDEEWNVRYNPSRDIFRRQTRLDADGTTYLTRLRGSDSKLYSDQLLHWGFSLTHKNPRLMVCYDRETEFLGVCVRTFHGIIPITNISTTNSMYT